MVIEWKNTSEPSFSGVQDGFSAGAGLINKAFTGLQDLVEKQRQLNIAQSDRLSEEAMLNQLDQIQALKDQGAWDQAQQQGLFTSQALRQANPNMRNADIKTLMTAFQNQDDVLRKELQDKYDAEQAALKRHDDPIMRQVNADILKDPNLAKKRLAEGFYGLKDQTEARKSLDTRQQTLLERERQATKYAQEQEDRDRLVAERVAEDKANKLFKESLGVYDQRKQYINQLNNTVLENAKQEYSDYAVDENNNIISKKQFDNRSIEFTPEFHTAMLEATRANNGIPLNDTQINKIKNNILETKNNELNTQAREKALKDAGVTLSNQGINVPLTRDENLDRLRSQLAGIDNLKSDTVTKMTDLFNKEIDQRNKLSTTEQATYDSAVGKMTLETEYKIQSAKNNYEAKEKEYKPNVVLSAEDEALQDVEIDKWIDNNTEEQYFTIGNRGGADLKEVVKDFVTKKSNWVLHKGQRKPYKPWMIKKVLVNLNETGWLFSSTSKEGVDEDDFKKDIKKLAELYYQDEENKEILRQEKDKRDRLILKYTNDLASKKSEVLNTITTGAGKNTSKQVEELKSLYQRK